MSTEGAARRLPLWSKALITLVVLGLAATYALGVAAIFGVKQLALKCIDPAEIARTAKHIGQFPQPLPSGFRYVVGMHLDALGLDMLTIEHQPEKQLMTMICRSGPQSTGDAKASLKQDLQQGYSIGLNMFTTSAKFQDVKERNTARLASLEMPYILGHTVDVSGRKGEGMVGCIQVPVKESTKNILIYALQTTDVPYNQQITMDLLNSIKGF